MSATSELSTKEALMRLGASTAEAIAQVLEMFAPGSVERGDVSVMGDGQSPFTGSPAARSRRASPTSTASPAATSSS